MSDRYFLPIILIAIMITGSAVGGDGLLVQARCGLGDTYAKAGSWTPIEVSISYYPSDTSSVIDGEIVILPGEYRKVRYVQPLRMGQGRKIISFNILPSDSHFNNQGYCFTVQVTNRRQIVFEKKFVIAGTWMLLDSRTSMVVGIGTESLFGMQTGPLLPFIKNKENDQRQVLVTSTGASMLPVALKGLDSADVLLWYNPQTTALSEAQLAAISNFVRCGGHLVLVAAPETLLTTLGDLPLPARFEGSANLSLRHGNGQLSSVFEKLVFNKYDGVIHAPANSTITINRMRITGGRVEATRQNLPLLVRGNFGRGRISMMALPLNDKLFKLNPRLQAAIVSRLIDLPIHKEQLEFCKNVKPAAQPAMYYPHTYRTRGPAEVANSFLTNVKELKPISVVLIILFLIAFFLLSGPVSYFVLKRKNRLEWTYPVFGIVSISFLIISYGGAYAIKGNRNFVRDVTVIDLCKNGAAQQTSYYALFSSRPRMIQPACNPGMFVSGQGESDLRGRGYNNNQSPSLLPVAGSDLIISTPAFTSPATIMLRQWQIQQFVATGPIKTDFGLSLHRTKTRELKEVDAGGSIQHKEKSEENHTKNNNVITIKVSPSEVAPKAIMVKAEMLIDSTQVNLDDFITVDDNLPGDTVINTGSTGFRKTFLVTDTCVWETGRVDPGERVRLEGSVSLSSALKEAIKDESEYDYRYEYGELKESLKLGDVMAICFPALTKAYYRTAVSSEENSNLSYSSPGNDLDALIKALCDKKKKPALSRWQIISSMAQVDDYQHLDMTRVLCEGGAVLIGLSDQPGSRIDTGKTNAIRTSQTIVRVICNRPQE